MHQHFITCCTLSDEKLASTFGNEAAIYISYRVTGSTTIAFGVVLSPVAINTLRTPVDWS